MPRPPLDIKHYLMMEPTRLLTFNPPPIEPLGQTDYLRMQFDAGGGMLVGFRGSIVSPVFTGLDSDSWLSSLFFRMYFNAEEAVTVGTVPFIAGTPPEQQPGQLSLESGWTSFECCFSRQDTTFFPFWRWVVPSDRLYVSFQNRSTFDTPLQPTMTMGMVRERDFQEADPRWPG